jgi:hypothetical protein
MQPNLDLFIVVAVVVLKNIVLHTTQNKMDKCLAAGLGLGKR